MQDSTNNNESKPIEQDLDKPIAKKELVELKDDIKNVLENFNVVLTNIDTRIKGLEQQKTQIPEQYKQAVQPQQAPPQQPQQLDLATLATLIKTFGGGSGGGEFGTDENKQFFAEVGKADFDTFRLMQQRRFLKQLEKATPTV